MIYAQTSNTKMKYENEFDNICYTNTLNNI